MSITTILIIVLVIILLGGVNLTGNGGPYLNGGLGLVLVVLLILALMGRL